MYLGLFLCGYICCRLYDNWNSIKILHNSVSAYTPTRCGRITNTCLVLLKTNINKLLDKIKLNLTTTKVHENNIHILNFYHNRTQYQLRLKQHKKPQRPLWFFTTTNGEDVTDHIFSMLGPNYDFYGQDMKLSDLYSECPFRSYLFLTFTDENNKKKTFYPDDLVILPKY
jgi:hypothetical protein